MGNYFKKNVRRKLQYTNLQIIIILLYVFIFLFTGHYLQFHYAVSIFCATFAISLGIVTIVRKVSNEYKYIGIGFLFVGIIEYVKLFFNIIEGYTLFNDIMKIMENTNKGLEIIIILTSSMCLRKNYNIKQTVKFYSIITFVLAVFYYLIFNIVNHNEYYDNVMSLNLICQMIIVLVILYKEKIKKDITIENKFIYVYLLFIVLYNVIYNIKIQNYITFILADILEYCAYLSIYKGITKNVLVLVYDKMKSNIEDVRKKESELNKELRNRNAILNELNLLNNKSEKRYCNLIESFKDGIIIFKNDRVAYINNEALLMMGLDYKANILNRSFYNFLQMISIEQMIDKENIKAEENINIFNTKINKRYILKSKMDKYKELELYIIKSEQDIEIVYMRDMSELNKYNEMKEKYNEYLKQEEIKNKFYSNISHELRTPINIISSALKLNEVHLNKENLNLLSKNNNRIRQNCLRLIRTINNFIDTNKISEGYLIPNKKIYNIVEIVENATISTKKYVDKIKNTLIFDSEFEEINLACDRDLIERVILNLLSNSVKYGEDGGKIIVNLSMQKRNIKIVVKNNSRPIKKEEEPYIFDQFTNLNKSLSREKEGSGLGLYLTKAIVNLHEGTIYYKSCKEGWNKFIINLPIEDNLGKYPKGENVEIISLDKKVDVEFSDIYL
ncbi:sensor histidine kinase [Clostridium baratii]|uniref:ATP-binding protein n=2 Tax=Clostridium baratii TaxID=1561 RepID=UPI0006C4FB2A|nr:ATP-binding protein [Clostridium baratii]MDU1052824.1 ATP-binding protein [Clostridium baratii]MDU4912158.1 ATP-binding protein [Clostridium baratii]CUP23661.1 sensor histidine kinase [Clostridium baratii]